MQIVHGVVLSTSTPGFLWYCLYNEILCFDCYDQIKTFFHRMHSSQLPLLCCHAIVIFETGPYHAHFLWLESEVFLLCTLQ